MKSTLYSKERMLKRRLVQCMNMALDVFNQNKYDEDYILLFGGEYSYLVEIDDPYINNMLHITGIEFYKSSDPFENYRYRFTSYNESEIVKYFSDTDDTPIMLVYTGSDEEFSQIEGILSVLIDTYNIQGVKDKNGEINSVYLYALYGDKYDPFFEDFDIDYDWFISYLEEDYYDSIYDNRMYNHKSYRERMRD